MTHQFPTYAKTNHPDVLASMEKTKALREEFREKLRDVSEKYTGDRYAAYTSGWEHDRVHMSGIAADKLLPEMKTGRWKQPRNGVIEPYANNPVSKDFNIGYKADIVPGRGNILWGNGRMGTGTLFVWNGYVYSYMGFTAEISEKLASERDEYGWEEVLGSEIHKAIEDYNDALNEKE